jgi:hypothetical protein
MKKCLALALRHNPMLDPLTTAGMRIGPARNIAGCKDFRRASLEVFIYNNALSILRPARWAN